MEGPPPTRRKRRCLRAGAGAAFIATVPLATAFLPPAGVCPATSSFLTYPQISWQGGEGVSYSPWRVSPQLGKVAPLGVARGSKPSGFKTKNRRTKRKGPKTPKQKSDDDPDGEEEVIELSMPVEDLIAFSEDLEGELKKAKLRNTAPGAAVGRPPVILNVTGVHWILSQVAYDAGVRRLAVPGLGSMKDASELLPDDIEWILTGGLTVKSVRRIPAISALKIVYINSLEQAEMLEEALKHEEERRAEKTPLQKVSKSRLKYLQKRDSFGINVKLSMLFVIGTGGTEDSERLTRAIALAPLEMSSATEVLDLASAIKERCPRLILWGLSLERCPAAVEAVGKLRSMLGADPTVILPSEDAKQLAKAATAQSLAWESILSMLTVEAPLIEDESSGIQEDDDVEEYDPLTAEGDGLEEEEEEEVAEVVSSEELRRRLGGDPAEEQVGDDDDEDEVEGEDEEEEDGYGEGVVGEEGTEEEERSDTLGDWEGYIRLTNAGRVPGQGPVSRGKTKSANKPAQQKKKGRGDDEDDDEEFKGGAYGAVLDRKGW